MISDLFEEGSYKYDRPNIATGLGFNANVQFYDFLLGLGNIIKIVWSYINYCSQTFGTHLRLQMVLDKFVTIGTS